MTITLRVNGRPVTASVPARMTLADFVRDRLRLTGTHLGCGQGLCGCCNVLLDERSVRACLLLAVQADGKDVVTVEGISAATDFDDHSSIAGCLVRHHALQCGFCTPGFVVLLAELLAEVDRGARPAPAELRTRLAGCLCRCTGYAPILAAAEELVAAKIVECSR
ncbi:(2Fe-2S)-binding protein [Mycobacterium botniense]|uniref:(2Fe-2S)-binding protein n=1 Tax=Mycobacterium botniense TaxID=84962 RepID=A0A7I9XTA1_9MYCO|nr:(2Fe-2S)-binding protein [Mycobacterium botniense]